MKRLKPLAVLEHPEQTRIIITNTPAGRYALHMILALDDAARKAQS